MCHNELKSLAPRRAAKIAAAAASVNFGRRGGAPNFFRRRRRGRVPAGCGGGIRRLRGLAFKPATVWHPPQRRRRLAIFNLVSDQPLRYVARASNTRRSSAQPVAPTIASCIHYEQPVAATMKITANHVILRNDVSIDVIANDHFRWVGYKMFVE